jgi:hypothetical protein
MEGRALLVRHAEETRDGRIPVLTFSLDESQPSISETSAPKSHCMALEDFDASEIVTLNFESIRPSLKGTNKLLRVPEPSDYTNYFIVDCLVVAAETFVQQFSLSELGLSSQQISPTAS